MKSKITSFVYPTNNKITLHKSLKFDKILYPGFSKMAYTLNNRQECFSCATKR